jgi:hypothetical protein
MGNPSKGLTPAEEEAAFFAAADAQGGELAWREGEKLFGIFRGVEKGPGDDPEVGDVIVVRTASGLDTKRWSFGLLAHLLEKKNVKVGDKVAIVYKGKELNKKDNRTYHRCALATAADLLPAPVTV